MNMDAPRATFTRHGLILRKDHNGTLFVTRSGVIGRLGAAEWPLNVMLEGGRKRAGGRCRSHTADCAGWWTAIQRPYPGVPYCSTHYRQPYCA